jgi:hypothetical protein
MMRGAAVVFLVASLLSGCSDKDPAWQDTTGRGRSPEAADMDMKACLSLPARATAAQEQAAIDQATECMKRRGWVISEG